MMSLTRAQALTQARLEFSHYVDRVADSGRLSRQYLSDIGRYWDRRLDGLSRLGSDLPVSSEVIASLMTLARELRVPNLDPDAEVRWVDKFPDRVADLFPPSAVTFRLIDQTEEEEAAQIVHETTDWMGLAS
jgi:hypothetical protein